MLQRSERLQRFALAICPAHLVGPDLPTGQRFNKPQRCASRAGERSNRGIRRHL
jgi:hypothetical protein